MAELAVVLAIVGIAMAIGGAGLVSMVGAQKRNAALSMTNLALREQRALALERRTPRYVKPNASGNGVVIGGATTVPASGRCIEGPVEQELDAGGLTVSGDRICFTEDGNTDDASATQGLVFHTPGEVEPVAEVQVYPAGVLKWSGAFHATEGLAVTTISVESVATAQVAREVLQ